MDHGGLESGTRFTALIISDLFDFEDKFRVTTLIAKSRIVDCLFVHFVVRFQQPQVILGLIVVVNTAEEVKSLLKIFPLLNFKFCPLSFFDPHLAEKLLFRIFT